MPEKEEVYFGKEKILFHPVHKRMETARWVGWYKFYSQWEFVSDGFVILGEPYRKE